MKGSAVRIRSSAPRESPATAGFLFVSTVVGSVRWQQRAPGASSAELPAPARTRVAREHGRVDPTGVVAVARYDLTAELSFRSAADGLAWHAAVALLPVARLDAVVRHAPLHVGRQSTSVTWERPSGGRVFQVHDAGVRHGTHGPGHRIRLERQHRVTRPAQPERSNVCPQPAAVVAAPRSPPSREADRGWDGTGLGIRFAESATSGRSPQATAWWRCRAPFEAVLAAFRPFGGTPPREASRGARDACWCSESWTGSSG